MPPSFPEQHPACASTSSSGLADGLGRRWLAFDREEGAMLERLTVRPELAAFETLLRDRLDRLAGLEDERIARPRTLVRGSAATLVAISEFVPGTRLSDLLDAAEADGAVPGVDAALGFLLDVLPALCGLHAGAGFAHGTIAPSRTVLTPAGQIVLLDAIYGDALSHLRFSRRRLWTEFGLAVRPAAGAPTLDAPSDIAQAALSAVMLVLGRPLRLQDLVGGLSAVLAEVIDVAQIRASEEFAQRFSGFVERALPFFADPPFATADDALIEVRQLAADLGGVHVCRRALIEFIDRMEPPGEQTTDGDGPETEDVFEEVAAAEPDPFGLLDEGLVSVVIEEADDEEEDETEAKIDLDAIADPESDDLDDPLILAELALPEPSSDPWHDELTREAPLPPPAPATALDGALELTRPAVEDTALSELTAFAAAAPAEPAPARSDVPEVAVPSAGGEALDGARVAAERDADSPSPAVRARRARKNRSARARKDRLRSARAAAAPAESPEKQPAEKPPGGGWLVRPDRLPVFEAAPAVPTPAPHVVPFPSPPPAVAHPPPQAVIPPPAMSIYAPVPAPPVQPGPFAVATPTAPAAPASPYAVPWSPPPGPPVLAPPMASPPLGAPPFAPAGLPRLATVKLKESAPRARAARPNPVGDMYTAPFSKPPSEGPPARFPWKIAAVIVAVILVAVVAGRAYIPARSTDNEATAAAAAIAAAAEAKPPFRPPAAPTGRLEIETQPAGARVLLNGTPAGETPLTLDAVPAGRHTVTFLAPSGSVRRTVRIEAGRTVKLDVPIFSGWVGIFAPFVVEVSAGGRVVGTTEEPRIMLSPGRHELTLTNRELGYRAVQSVDIEPGQVRTLTIDPRGRANLNATPWAEVWIDGQKVGETPLANLELPLGTREVVFRHPQFGERRTTVTIRADKPAALSVDMGR
jgi:hypothetical protein